MDNTLTITAATPADVPELVALVNSAYRGDSSRRGWTTEADLLSGQRTDAAALLDTIATAHTTILTCRATDGRLLGCVYLQKQAARLYLGMLSVAPDAQAHGIGKYLLSAGEEYAKRVDCQYVVMTVISVRTELIAWYERHGYCKTGETEPFPTDPRFGIPKQPLEFVKLIKSIAVKV